MTAAREGVTARVVVVMVRETVEGVREEVTAAAATGTVAAATATEVVVMVASRWKKWQSIPRRQTAGWC